MAYNGSVELAAGIKPKNNGSFPMVNAHDVYVDDSTRLDAKLTSLGNSASIATTEASSTASSAHAVGSYLFLDGTLYEVTAAISVGDTIEVGTNVATVPGGLSGEVSDLKSAMDDNNQQILSLASQVVNDMPVITRYQTGRYIPTGFNNTTTYARNSVAFPAGKYQISACAIKNRACKYGTYSSGEWINPAYTTNSYVVDVDAPWYINFYKDGVAFDDTDIATINSTMVITRLFDDTNTIETRVSNLEDDVEALQEFQTDVGVYETANDLKIARLNNTLGFSKNYIEGYYVDREGNLVVDSEYCTTEMIPCSMIQPRSCTFYYGTYGGTKTNFVYYDANGDFVGFYGATSGAAMRSISSLPDTAIYCRFGFVKGYAAKLTTSQGYVFWDARDLSIIETETHGYPPSQRSKASSGNLASGGTFLETNAVKNPTIMFYGKIGTFDSISIGHGQNETYTQYITVDDTNLTIYSGTNTTGSSVAHGLTINTYISVIIDIKYNCDYTVIINTLGGSFKRNFAYPSAWLGNKGSIFAKSGSANTITDFNFTFTAPYEKSKWVFGDSYLSNYSDKRWPYYMQLWGFDNALLNAFPGEASVEAYNDFTSALLHGSPKYIVWAVGMNDGDSGAINASWYNIVQRVKADCERRGIELILVTIPNVPTITHTYKNTWIKNTSGCRYIDFAEAVGASEAASTWYDGCLETTTPRIHPTADGARLLACRALTDFPELMQP